MVLCTYISYAIEGTSFVILSDFSQIESHLSLGTEKVKEHYS